MPGSQVIYCWREGIDWEGTPSLKLDWGRGERCSWSLGMFELLNSDESVWPEELTSPPRVEAVPPPLSQINPEAVSMQDNSWFPSGLTPSTAFCYYCSYRPTSRLKSQLTTKGKVQSMTHEEVHYIPKNYLSFLICTDKSPGMCVTRY